MPKKVVSFFLFGVVCFWCVPVREVLAGPPGWTETTFRFPVVSDVVPNQRLGASIALQGDLIVAGATGDTEAGSFAGAVYVYRLNRYQGEITVVDKLIGSGVGASDAFGTSVAIEGDFIFAATSLDPETVYAFKRIPGTHTYNETQLVLPEMPGSSSSFGSAMAAEGDTLVIGASTRWDFRGPSYGVLHFFQRDPATDLYSEVTMVEGSDVHSDRRLGYSVAIAKGIVVAGAYGHEPNGRGAVYVFRRVDGVWTEVAKLIANNALDNDSFGRGVAISPQGNRIAVGAFMRQTFRGGAYIFDLLAGTDTWNQVGFFQGNGGQANDYYGHEVAVVDDLAIVSTHFEDQPSQSCGSAYVYKRNSGNGLWEHEAKLFASDVQTWAEFSEVIVYDGEKLVAGARYAASGGQADAGVLYAYSSTGCDPDETGNPTSGLCEACPAGTSRLLGLPCSCPEMHFFNDTASMCQACPTNSVGVPPASHAITDCQCARGYYHDGVSECVQCPAGTHIDVSPVGGVGITACVPCPVGTHIKAGETACTECAPGTVSDQGKSLCTACPSFFTSDTGSDSCYLSPTGAAVLSGAALVPVIIGATMVAVRRRSKGNRDSKNSKLTVISDSDNVSQASDLTRASDKGGRVSQASEMTRATDGRLSQQSALTLDSGNDESSIGMVTTPPRQRTTPRKGSRGRKQGHDGGVAGKTSRAKASGGKNTMDTTTALPIKKFGGRVASSGSSVNTQYTVTSEMSPYLPDIDLD